MLDGVRFRGWGHGGDTFFFFAFVYIVLMTGYDMLYGSEKLDYFLDPSSSMIIEKRFSVSLCFLSSRSFSC